MSVADGTDQRHVVKVGDVVGRIGEFGRVSAVSEKYLYVLTSCLQYSKIVYDWFVAPAPLHQVAYQELAERKITREEYDWVVKRCECDVCRVEGGETGATGG